jgi:predicted DNA-binding mobile mystery protein A
MMDRRRAATARANLDQRFEGFGSVEAFARPVHGWIRAIREALGMTTRQLSRRMRVAQSSILDFEKSEVDDTIKLSTLRRAAEALDCTLVYALVPNKPLATIVRDRARRIIRNQLAPVEHSMTLEDQRVDITNRQVEDLILGLDPRKLWDDD